MVQAQGLERRCRGLEMMRWHQDLKDQAGCRHRNPEAQMSCGHRSPKMTQWRRDRKALERCWCLNQEIRSRYGHRPRGDTMEKEALIVTAADAEALMVAGSLAMEEVEAAHPPAALGALETGEA